ncbi:methylated-DNA--[protein]-cysteine S-methyltransferase [Phocea massiliensis]|jgi:methylated-DNA-[protein]-cysteine S-methyltransferase|uniref:Methylated-DNA--protein-cysteine methyltransferase n=1 Tax=uncultured Anaerotruncus sp. TaxID=905011 RepID=A0A6N2V0R5_9FIRM|nr:methylated-DNA--[protein]-cysteine S-methyltransferase [Merdimmobilis hominis]MCD4836960.1 methylated-DNA--[protein]-cysteine S-methyltransferase [Merdimmobilis hominis]
MLYYYSLQSRLGTITLVQAGEALIRLILSPQDADLVKDPYLARHFLGEELEERRTDLMDRFVIQLAAYLKGKQKGFDLPYQLYGSPFARRVWEELGRIPYGETVSYGELAKRCGTEGVQAVGTAVGNNPLPLILPCHRVIRADGALGQYSAGEGPSTKRLLLQLEGAAFREQVT